MAKKEKTNLPPDLAFEQYWDNLQAAEKPLPSHSQFRTGSLFIDLSINPRNPGIPAGSWVNLYGEGQAAKTTQALMMAREHTAVDGGLTIYIDLEGGLDLGLANAYGLNPYTNPNFLYYKPDFLNDGLKRAQDMILYHYHRDPLKKVLIICDGAGLSPARPSGKDQDKNTHGTVNDVEQMCIVAQLLSNFAKFKTVLRKTNCLLVVTKHSTVNVQDTYGDKVYLGGGVKFKAAADLTLLLSQSSFNATKGVADKQTINDDEGALFRYPMRIKWKKNKFSTIKPDTEYWLLAKEVEEYGGHLGVDDISLCANYLVDRGVIKKSGAWFEVPSGKKFQGLENLVVNGWQSPELFNEITELTVNEFRKQYL